MELVIYNRSTQRCGLRGPCPHCSVVSLCTPVIDPYRYNKQVKGKNITDSGVCVITQCQSCQEFVLLITYEDRITRNISIHAYYPLGSADDSVTDSVPKKIASDFSEALRCFHVKCYKATVTMCRRAIQASSKEFRAGGEQLIHQIDDLAKKGKITESLKEMAHQIRKIGNDGAHPDNDILKEVTEQDASEIIEFIREYFAHVYVMPKKLKDMKKRKT